MLNYLTECVSQKASGRGRAALKVRCPAIMKPQSERAKMPLQLIATKCSAKWNKQEQRGQTFKEDVQNIKHFNVYFLV